MMEIFATNAAVISQYKFIGLASRGNYLLDGKWRGDAVCMYY